MFLIYHNCIVVKYRFFVLRNLVSWYASTWMLLTTGLNGALSLCVLILAFDACGDSFIWLKYLALCSVKVSHFVQIVFVCEKMSVGTLFILRNWLSWIKASNVWLNLFLFYKNMVLASPEYKTLSYTKNINERHKYLILLIQNIDPLYFINVTIYNINSGVSTIFFQE